MGRVPVHHLVWLCALSVFAERRRSSPLALDDALAPLEGSCFSFAVLGEYWAYTWCHKKSVFQVHSDGKRTTEKVIGRYSSSQSKKSSGHVFTDGEHCPGSSFGQGRRRATVDFLCCDDNGLNGSRNDPLHLKRNVWIEDVEEKRTCDYAVTVCTRLVCSSNHSSPRYRRRSEMSSEKRMEYRDLARSMFVKSYDAYMEHAYPLGELLPKSCGGAHLDVIKIPIVTLIDSLDTLAILGNRSEFGKAVLRVGRYLTANGGFDIDANVSVFETNIRVLGGLLAAHMLAVDGRMDGYDGSLLVHAIDLGTRLLPAFETSTGIPFGTVNLATGVPRGESVVSNLAGSGSLSLEFSVLSALTGDERFGEASRKAVRSLFERRSQLGLLGKHINIKTGKWVEPLSGIGSNSDSFYEYLLKMYLLFGEVEFWGMFAETYRAVLKHLRRGDWYADVDMNHQKKRAGRREVFENLQAFWPGMQALAGDVKLASRTLNAFYLVWSDWGAIPEEFDFLKMRLISTRASALRYPLRPELVESTYLLHRATNDSSWLWAAAQVLESLSSAEATCGFATVTNAATSETEDSMPSYFLSETIKYLYLLFDDDNFINRGDFVFSTEAHPFSAHLLRKKHEEEHLVPFKGTLVGEVSRTKKKETLLPEEGQCSRPRWWEDFGWSRSFVDEVQLSAKHLEESEIFTAERTQLDSPRCPRPRKGWTMKAPYEVEVPSLGQLFTIDLSADGFKIAADSTVEVSQLLNPIAEVSIDATRLALARDGMELLCEVNNIIPCSLAQFGDSGRLAVVGDEAEREVEGVLRSARTPEGCEPSSFFAGQILLVRRGGCYFEEKSRLAKQAGAVGLIVVNTAPERFVMATASSGRRAPADLPVVMVSSVQEAELEVGSTVELRIAKRSRDVKVTAAPGERVLHLPTSGWAAVVAITGAAWRLYIVPHESRRCLAVDDDGHSMLLSDERCPDP